MRNSWLKLYFEILQDPKMGMMSDHLFRRTIELFLLAGQEDKDGLLPDIRGIAWSLHTTEKDVTDVLQKLNKLNIIEVRSDGYYVTHFVTRQNTQLSDAERAKKYRDNKKSSRNSCDESSENVTVDKEKDKDKEKIKNKKEIKERDREKNCDETSQTPAPQKTPKHRHGNFNHVLLTIEEWDKLLGDFGYDITRQYVQKLDDYLENNPSKHYANHNLTIRNWIKKDEDQKQQTFQAKPQQHEESFTEIAQRIQRERDAKLC